MGVDVIDLVGSNSSVGERSSHDPHCAIAVGARRGDVIGVAGHPVSDNLRVNGGPSSEGMLQLFQDEHAGAFPHDEAIALAIERAAGFCGFLIAR